jgi:hypothetical protein
LTAGPADLLFVFAGADARKSFAVRAWHEGAARTLAVSVARFEWRRVPGLGLPAEGGLVALVEATPPHQRLFVLVVEAERVAARRVWKGRWGTWSEAAAVAALVRERAVRTLLVCTSDYHLPRAVGSVRRALALAGIRDCSVAAIAAPEPPESPLAPERRGRSPRAWRLLAREAFKGAVYALGVPMLTERPPR